MLFSLHPSGYLAPFNEKASGNLIAGTPCPECRRVSGHSIQCPFFAYDETKGKTSRPSLFNATAILWAMYRKRSLFTFTLPSLEAFTYQRDFDCPETGDLVIAAKFSKVMEAWSIREKRRGHKLSYTWVSEAQMKRRTKFGGIGDIHFHVAANVAWKSNNGKVIDLESLQWLQNLWCEHVGKFAGNCIDVRPIQDDLDSIPGYMQKYMAKGSMRMIISRRFAATRDLTRFKPIHLKSFPDVEVVNQVTKVIERGSQAYANGYKNLDPYEATVYYLNTSQVLELYGAHMAAESDFHSSGSMKGFHEADIFTRRLKRHNAWLQQAYTLA